MPIPIRNNNISTTSTVSFAHYTQFQAFKWVLVSQSCDPTSAASTKLDRGMIGWRDWQVGVDSKLKHA